MERYERAAVLISLIEALHSERSWCGQTHLQKSAYILQGLAEVPLGLPFILYKYGPYSFDLSDELTTLRAESVLRLDPQPAPYGPRHHVAEKASLLKSLYSDVIEQYLDDVRFVAEVVGSKGVTELERLATALYVSLEIGWTCAKEDRAQKLHELKPHVSSAEALDAVNAIDGIREQNADRCAAVNGI